MTKTPVKTLNGVTITGPRFVYLLTKFVDTVNKGALPDLPSM